MTSSDLLYLYALFIPALIIAVFVFKKLNERRKPHLTEMLKILAIQSDTHGYASGKTVFSSQYVFLTDKALVGVDMKKPNEIVKLPYKEISSIKLKGWMLMKLSVKTTSGEKMNVAPISRVSIDGTEVLIYPDTAGEYYMKYMGLFHHFVEALEAKGVKKTATATIQWKLGSVRRVVSSFFVAFLILASITAAVVWVSEA